MMNPHNPYCPVCGGITMKSPLTLNAVAVGLVRWCTCQQLPIAGTATIPLVQTNVPTVRFCIEHPESKPVHDGKLDERNDARVYYGLVAAQNGNYQGIYIDSFWGDESTCLLPKQALSLLVWLQQEKPALERLIQESET